MFGKGIKVTVSATNIVLNIHDKRIQCKYISARGRTLKYTQTNGWQSHVKIRHNKQKTWQYNTANNDSEMARGEHSYKQMGQQARELTNNRFTLLCEEESDEEKINTSNSEKC